MSLSDFMAIAALAMTMAAANPSESPANDFQIWQDPNYDFSQIRKVFVLPVEADISTNEKNLIPEKQFEKGLEAWVIKDINSAVKKGSMIIKTFDDLVKDMNFIYGQYNADLFYSRAAEMGYQAFVRVAINQEFKTEHIPESYRTYTEYREIEHRDPWGRLIEVTRIPEERTEIIPAHDITYITTVCQPQLYSTSDAAGDYKAAVVNTLVQEYQGSGAMLYVEKTINVSLKTLFTFPKTPAPKTRKK